MVIKSVNLETVCGITSTIPDNEYNEVAFAGKSNVGKSSLINALMNRKSLARISSQPGKTQTINYYNINDEIYFVDLPGYGYAQANEHVKAQWGKMIEDYLHKSKQLKLVFLLIGICGYFTVPTVASWIVQAGGFNSYNNLVTQGGKWLGGFAMGSITGAGKYIKGQGKRIAEEERKFKMRHPNIK